MIAELRHLLGIALTCSFATLLLEMVRQLCGLQWVEKCVEFVIENVFLMQLDGLEKRN
jgi:hypothetical protein